MDVENEYYLVRFKSKVDNDMVLTLVSWIVVSHYLTVQPWTVDFNPLKPFPNMVLAWIWFSIMLGFLCKRQVLKAIGNMIGNVAHLDVKTDNGTRGLFDGYLFRFGETTCLANLGRWKTSTG